MNNLSKYSTIISSVSKQDSFGGNKNSVLQRIATDMWKPQRLLKGTNAVNSHFLIFRNICVLFDTVNNCFMAYMYVCRACEIVCQFPEKLLFAFNFEFLAYLLLGLRLRNFFEYTQNLPRSDLTQTVGFS